MRAKRKEKIVEAVREISAKCCVFYTCDRLLSGQHQMGATMLLHSYLFLLACRDNEHALDALTDP